LIFNGKHRLSGVKYQFGLGQIPKYLLTYCRLNRKQKKGQPLGLSLLEASG